MRSSFSLGLCIAVLLCSSVKTDNETVSPQQYFESMTTLKEAFLQNWAYEIYDSRNVLVYPSAVLQEFLLEYALRLPEGSAERAKIAEAMPFDTGLPFALNLSNLTVAPLQELTVQTFYTNTTPEMSNTMADPIYFSYKAFMEWSKGRLNGVSSARTEPFNPLLTVAAMRINAMQSRYFTWVDRIHFRVSERQRIDADALSNVGSYDYAEFSYPQLSNCTAGAIRLKVNDEASIIFIIARNVTDAQCSSSENLLKILQDTNLEMLNFTPKIMFVSIPVLHVSTIVMPERKLTQAGLLETRPNGSSTSRGFADHYESASLIFNPEVPKDAPIPMISANTPSFHADRPFLVAVLQKFNPVPVLLGLIQNPNAPFECCSPPEPMRIAITVLNKGKYKGRGKRSKGQQRHRTR